MDVKHLCEVEHLAHDLRSHTCFPWGQLRCKDSWVAATAFERKHQHFLFSLSVNVWFAWMVGPCVYYRLKCPIYNSVCTDSNLYTFSEALQCRAFEDSCSFFQSVCASRSTCLPVVWRGWELIALYIEVYVRGGLRLDCEGEWRLAEHTNEGNVHTRHLLAAFLYLFLCEGKNVKGCVFFCVTGVIWEPKEEIGRWAWLWHWLKQLTVCMCVCVRDGVRPWAVRL